jgi:hypothetical protein
MENVNSYLYALPGSDNLTITYCHFDISSGDGTLYGGIITNRGGGTFTLSYNVFANSGGDLVQFQSASGTTAWSFNYFAGAGLAPGAHGDWTQFIGGPYGGTETYNTGYENSGTTQGFMWEPDISACDGALSAIDFEHNTFSAQAGMIYPTAVTVCDLPSSPVPAYLAAHNYWYVNPAAGGNFAPGGGRGGTGDGSTATNYVDNINMSSGSDYAK